jgi:hypothetical protein
VAAFTVYFDASGKDGQSVVTVAGFVSGVKKWERFDKEWAAILLRSNVSAMRPADFASSKGEFKNWKGPAHSERRRAFVADLAECIRRHAKRGFAVSVNIAEYEDIDKEYELSQAFGKPYVICAVACLGSLNNWMERNKFGRSETLVVIEDGDEGKGDFIDRARYYGYKVIALPKSDAQSFSGC